MSDVTMESVSQLTEAKAKFIVMSNVLGGIRDYDQGGWLPGRPAHAKAADAIIRNGKTLALPRMLGQKVGRLLRIAWQTELAARVCDAYDDDMLRRVAAQTLPVQAYYAVFNAARAMTASAGTTCGTHQAVHRDFESQRAKRSYGSWAVTLAGDPLSPIDCILVPAITTPKSFNPMQLSHQPEDYVCAALRMTRRWKVDSAREDWMKKNKTKNGKPRKKLPPAERVRLISNLRPTTLMDFLYELRRRSNYEGVDEYGSDAEDICVERFHRGLLHVADMGLLHYETMLVQYVGLQAFEDEVSAWSTSAAKIGSWAVEAVERRLRAIKLAIDPAS